MLHCYKNNGPIFIVGVLRSGTTLLQYMLRSHPRIFLPTGESHFMVAIYHDRLQYGDLNQPRNIERILKDMYRQSQEFLETESSWYSIRNRIHGKIDPSKRLLDDP